MRRGIGLAVYVEKTGLGPFETAHVEARRDGRFTVDTGASSMGPGLETVLAQILGGALGLPATASTSATRTRPSWRAASARTARGEP
jgi:CO/xanthine dehydrogenase Mo-binding subunit